MLLSVYNKNKAIGGGYTPLSETLGHARKGKATVLGIGKKTFSTPPTPKYFYI